jgi:hypothetical protein
MGSGHVGTCSKSRGGSTVGVWQAECLQLVDAMSVGAGLCFLTHAGLLEELAEPNLVAASKLLVAMCVRATGSCTASPRLLIEFAKSTFVLASALHP